MILKCVNNFLIADELREAKILYGLSLTKTVSIAQYVDCFFDQNNYFYLVSEFCEVILRLLTQIIHFNLKNLKTKGGNLGSKLNEKKNIENILFK